MKNLPPRRRRPCHRIIGSGRLAVRRRRRRRRPVKGGIKLMVESINEDFCNYALWVVAKWRVLYCGESFLRVTLRAIKAEFCRKGADRRLAGIVLPRVVYLLWDLIPYLKSKMKF